MERGGLSKEHTHAYVKIYAVNPPHAYVGIFIDPLTNQYRYDVIEPRLFPNERKLLNQLKELLLDELDIRLEDVEKEGEAETYLKNKIAEVVNKYKIKISEETLGKIMYYIVRNFIGYGKIDVMMRDPLIEDISCDGPKLPVFVWHREYESIPTNVIFETPEELDSFVVRLAYRAGKHVSVAQPIIDGALPDGSRVQITYGREVSLKGSSFTIRKFRVDPLTIVDLIRLNTLTAEMAAYFWFAIENRASILIAGGVAAGKTTLLNALAIFIPPEFKIVSIEETPEINLPHKNWLQMVTRPGFGTVETSVTLFDLLKAAVRQRPDYIIVGEIRGEEAYTLFQAIATGHLCLSTIHADSVASVIRRLESEPMNIPRTLIPAMDIIAVMGKLRIANLPARRVLTVSEIVGLDRNREVLTNETYKWNPKADTFQYMGRSYLVEKIMRRKAYAYEEVQEELRRRKVILEWMVKKNIRKYTEVANIVRDYYADPERLYRRAVISMRRGISLET